MSARKPSRSFVIVVMTVFALTASVCLLVAQRALAEEHEIGVEELPKVIRLALLDVKVAEVEQETKKGVRTYEVTIEKDDVEIELKLDTEGHLLGIEVEHEDDEDGDEDGDDDGDDEDDDDDDDDDDDGDEDDDDEDDDDDDDDDS